VGYSRLIGEDEAGTLSVIRAHREELLEPKVGQYHGRVVKLMGDGALMEFPSAVEAVACAVEVQCTMAERNAGIPENRQIVYRMGINVGDIVIEDDDILGDGVNIAARLEGLAEPGGICVARNVFNQVGGKLDLTFELVGRRKVKNISQPVTIHRVVLDEKAAALVTPVVREGTRPQQHQTWRLAAALAIILLAGAGGLLWWSPWKAGTDPVPEEREVVAPATRPAIAVLPFVNMSGDKEQEYFSDGMTEDLITDLSKISALTVIARSSAFAYKGKSPEIGEIATELGVSHVVEGSVRKADGRVRITSQLIDAASGTHLWAERYDRDVKDIFALQDEVRGKIVAELRVTLTPTEQRQLARHETENAEAYDLYLQGLRQESFFTKDGNRESRRLFEQAITLDPNFAVAYAHLAQAYSLAKENRWLLDREETARKALELAEKAVELDSESPQAHWALARIITRPPIRDPERALVALRRTVELDPNYADGHAFLANVLNYVGRAEESLGVIATAIRINPHHPFWYVYLKGQSLFLLGRYEEAIPNFEIAIERNPTVAWPHRFLLASYGHLGRLDDAEWEISELESLGQPSTIKWVKTNSPIVYPEYLNRYLDGLRKAGVPEE
jgi:adenylate cyclase